MSTIISTVLISAPLAFVAGWVLSKAVFMNGQRGNALPRRKPAARERVEGADDRDAQIAELQQQLDLAEARILKARRSFKAWRERIRPIARQFRQQRMIISELRDELRRRDAATQQAEQTAANAPAAPAAAPAAKVETDIA